LANQEKTTTDLEKEISDAENKIFSRLSRTLGLDLGEAGSNVADFEEQRLARKKEISKARSSIQDQLSKLRAQQGYMSKRSVNVAEKLQTSESQQALERAQLNEARTALVAREEKLESLKTEAESLELEQSKLQGICEEKEADVKRLTKAKREIVEARGAMQKEVDSREARVERMRARLHTVLQKASMEQVELPRLNAKDTDMSDDNTMEIDKENMDASKAKGKGKGKRAPDSDGSLESDTTCTTQGSVSTVHFSQADHKAVQRDRDVVFDLDFNKLERNRENLGEAAQAAVRAEYEEHIRDLAAELERIQPDMRAADRYSKADSGLKAQEKEYHDVRDKQRTTDREFAEAKQKRQKIFMKAFRHISRVISDVYKELTRSPLHPTGGSAYLTLENQEEPYLAGIKYCVLPPGKRFRDMDQLSGGEKTIAALALLFSIHSYRPAPFYVMDEIDAALDNVNVQKVANFIMRRSRQRPSGEGISDELHTTVDQGSASMAKEQLDQDGKNFEGTQFLVISLKDIFYSRADALIGVTRNRHKCSSETLTLDLLAYEAEDEQERRADQAHFHAKTGDLEDDAMQAADKSPSRFNSGIGKHSAIGGNLSDSDDFDDN
jgi:structural maintenance of chromosome 1